MRSWLCSPTWRRSQAFLAKPTPCSPVIVPPSPGLLCAIGDLVAEFRNEFARTIVTPMDDVKAEDVATVLDELAAAGMEIAIGGTAPVIVGLLVAIGEIFVAPYAVVFDDVNKVEPDVLYISHARAVLLQTERDLVGAPELFVEVSSPTTRSYDVTVKRALYERSGVSEYWFVDATWSTLTIYRRAAGAESFAAPIFLDEPDAVVRPLHEAHAGKEVREHAGRLAVVLDRTAFYPTSGGQPFDTGTLGPHAVVAVEEALPFGRVVRDDLVDGRAK